MVSMTLRAGDVVLMGDDAAVIDHQAEAVARDGRGVREFQEGAGALGLGVVRRRSRRGPAFARQACCPWARRAGGRAAADSGRADSPAFRG